MIIWRLADPRFARDLSGAGNRLYGGRWNSPGRGVVYCAEHLSLAVLENLVHLPAVLRDDIPKRVVVRVQLPDEVPMLRVEVLPRAKRGAALDDWCRDFGNEWLNAGKALALRAPSVIVRQEFNILLNPGHPAMRRVRILDVKSCALDRRLSK